MQIAIDGRSSERLPAQQILIKLQSLYITAFLGINTCSHNVPPTSCSMIKSAVVSRSMTTITITLVPTHLFDNQRSSGRYYPEFTIADYVFHPKRSVEKNPFPSLSLSPLFLPSSDYRQRVGFQSSTSSCVSSDNGHARDTWNDLSRYVEPRQIKAEQRN